MGMYANHGVEYHVNYKSGKVKIIAPIHATDERLIGSMFFEKQKDEWLSGDVMYGRGSFMVRITDPEFDIELTDGERTALSKVLGEDTGDEVVEHGWYDVNYIHTTY